jgi:hypothetical protein
MQALSNAGITPDESSTYSRSEIQGALSGMHGEDVMLLCSDGALEQVYYYFHVKGNAIDGKYIPTRPCEYPVYSERKTSANREQWVKPSVPSRASSTFPSKHKCS